ncbi:TIGR02452 family protein [Allokutzneria sp. A3M-2-11 16]|uniref:TIGR02452 family protein n=1 Tax=Allokutzneria sp. A3M-2-11 16 TaxID=2962043 RepID=UPI0020B8A4A3|nr:TIGR02452 family protein [Allokutzneria sp. A3M-2-11 16]MCP3803115.1 TIGR02452 family protein [Allokutzneria sp. A3M-2-11 16]
MSSRLRAIARETVSIAERGWYQTASGGTVDISAGVTSAVSGTRIYQPEDTVSAPREAEPFVEVVNESSLDAARRLGGDLACLVFASARNPGGGFLNGAQAQEESLARGSALYPCLRAAWDFYVHHRGDPDLTYSDRVIYSPGVPVFRDDKGNLLDQPYPVSFLTSAAPNLQAIARNQPERAAGVPEALRRRAMRVLEVAADNGHRRLVLGAWGCGVFGNDPSTVADAFAEALRRGPWFEHVTFAVLDRGRDAPIYTAFRDRLN